MRITNVSYEKKISSEEKASISKYGSEMLHVDAIIAEEDNIDLCMLQIMERVHTHLNVKFNSPVLERFESFKKIQEKKAAQENKLTEKDTVPSPVPKERPEVVDEAKEIIEERREDKAAVEPKKKATKKKSVELVPEAPIAEPVVEAPVEAPVAEPVVEAPVVEPAPVVEAPVEAPVVEAPAEIKEEGVAYNRDDLTHKKEYVRIVTEYFPTWREDKVINDAVKAASRKLEGQIMYLPSGKISAKFTKLLLETMNG